MALPCRGTAKRRVSKAASWRRALEAQPGSCWELGAGQDQVVKSIKYGPPGTGPNSRLLGATQQSPASFAPCGRSSRPHMPKGSRRKVGRPQAQDQYSEVRSVETRVQSNEKVRLQTCSCGLNAFFLTPSATHPIVPSQLGKLYKLITGKARSNAVSLMRNRACNS